MRRQGFTKAMLVYPNHSPLFLNPDYEELRMEWMKELGLKPDQVAFHSTRSDGSRKEALVLFK